MAEKINEMSVSKLPGLEPTPMDSKAREETANPLTVAWNLSLKAALMVKEYKVTILPSDFKKDSKETSGAAA